MKSGFAPIFVLVAILVVTSTSQKSQKKEGEECNNKDKCMNGLACCYGRCRKVHVFTSSKCTQDKQCIKQGQCFKGFCTILQQCVPEDSWGSEKKKAITWMVGGQRCNNKDKCHFGLACCYGRCRLVHVFMSAKCTQDKECGKPGKCFKGYCTLLPHCVPDDSWESEKRKLIKWGEEGQRCNNKDKCMNGIACCYGVCRPIQKLHLCSEDKQCVNSTKCFKGHCSIIQQCVPDDSWEYNNSTDIVWGEDTDRCNNKDKCMFGLACCYGRCRKVEILMSAKCTQDNQCKNSSKCFKGYCTTFHQCVPEDSWESEKSKAIVWREYGQRCSNKDKCTNNYACCYGVCRFVRINVEKKCSLDKQCNIAYKAKCFKGYCTLLNQCVPEDSWESENNKSIVWRQNGQQCSNKDKCMFGLACCTGMCRIVEVDMGSYCSEDMDCLNAKTNCFKGYCTFLNDCVPEDS